ncbi:MAG: invasion associated locus B family protein [Proteobacteria bacterium]|nr:invasion associated locus B family protein [Pseudomonadota bacterium]
MKRYGKILAFRLLGCVALIFLASGAAGAAEPKTPGTFKNWSAYLLVENKDRICYLHGEPGKSAGKYKKRGDTYMQVTHRTGAKARNEVSVTAGYTYKKDSAVTLTIDGKKFVLFTHADTAWAGEENPDDKLVAAMRAGHTMVVAGASSRGTATVDSYSLAGFTAAHNAINKACGMK